MNCTSHCCGAEKVFDDKGVRKALKKYRKKGPEKFERQLLEALRQDNYQAETLLDIGGGIGALQHELLKEQLTSTTDVDSSEAYITGAKDLMKEFGFEDKMNFIHGDFNEHQNDINKHDIVTLSRVVCCYPKVDDLIKNSIVKANQYYGIIYPTDHWLVKAMMKLMNFNLYVRRNPFRVFAHSVEHMENLIKQQGFERVYLGKSMHWRTALYKRIK